MFYDKDPNDIDPVEGKGEEMIPEQGLPFEDVDDPMEGMSMELEDIPDNEARDLTPDELSELLGGSDGTDDFIAQPFPPAEMRPDSESAFGEGGMSAGHEEPMIMDFEMDGALPISSGGVKLPPPSVLANMPEAISLTDWDPSLTSTQHTKSHIGGSQGLEASNEMKELFITKERLMQIWDRIDVAQQLIREKVPSMSIAREMYDQVEAARNDLLANKDRYEEAERALNEVEMRLAVVARAQRDSPVATTLFIYLILWSSLFLTILVGFGVLSWGGSLHPNTIAFIFCGVAGGFGGIIGGLYSLWKHVSLEVDFSRQFSTWYVVNPIMGTFLGMFVYGVMQTGYSSLFDTGGVLDPTNAWVLYILAFIIGYQQNVAFDLMRRIIKMMFQLDTEINEKDPGKLVP